MFLLDFWKKWFITKYKSHAKPCKLILSWCNPRRVLLYTALKFSSITLHYQCSFTTNQHYVQSKQIFRFSFYIHKLHSSLFLSKQFPTFWFQNWIATQVMQPFKMECERLYLLLFSMELWGGFCDKLPLRINLLSSNETQSSNAVIQLFLWWTQHLTFNFTNTIPLSQTLNKNIWKQIKPCFWKNTAYNNVVAYLIKRGTLHNYFFISRYSCIGKEVLDGLVKVTTSFTWKMKKYGCVHGISYTLRP